MPWIVLDPEPNVTVMGNFDDSASAVEWVKNAIATETDPEWLTILQRCVVSPYDPERTT